MRTRTRATGYGRPPSPLLGFPRMSERQLYRLRAPSTGRELLLPPSPGKVYTRPGHGRGARGRGEGAPAAPVEVQPAMGRRDAALLQLVRSARPEGPQRLPDVRPPDGRAAPLRGGRMRLAPRLAVPIIVLALALAGCGGAQVAVHEVPGGPVELSVPGTATASRPPRRRRPPPTRHRDARTPTPRRPRRRPTPRRDRRDARRHRHRRHDRGRRRRGAGRRRTARRPTRPPPAGLARRGVRGLLRREPGRLLSRPVRSLKVSAGGRLPATPDSGKAQTTAHRTGHRADDDPSAPPPRPRGRLGDLRRGAASAALEAALAGAARRRPRARCWRSARTARAPARRQPRTSTCASSERPVRAPRSVLATGRPLAVPDAPHERRDRARPRRAPRHRLRALRPGRLGRRGPQRR